MQQKPYLIVSDVHLGAVSAKTEGAFREFLDFAERSASGLLINGDLFDFWFEYRTVILRQHFRVLARLAEMVERGFPVRFVGGNHDGWAGEVLSEDVGLEVFTGPRLLQLAGRNTLVAHGDGVGAGDRGYRVLRRVIRHPVSVRAFRALHPDLGSRIAGLASSTHAKPKDPAASHDGRIAAWATEQLRLNRNLDLVVAGHTHHARVTEVEPGRFYANSGAWLHERRSYLELTPDGGAPLVRWW